MAIECSVVVPLCDEEQNLPTLHLRLTATMRRLAIPYEIIYVDDGSSDRTAEMILELHDQESVVKGIFLSRNFGHQAALCAGLEAATGRAVITLDGDLQDPPELIPELIEKWREGCHIVFARRRKRKEHVFKRFAYFTFYRLLRRISSIEIPLDTGDFALMDRRAVEELNGLPERTRFIRGLRSWVGFRQAEVEYDRDLRAMGHTKYSFGRLLRLALDGLFGFSDVPLKAVSLSGCVVSTAGLVGLGLSLLNQWGVGLETARLLLLGSGLVLLGGIQLIGLGILGEYLARVHHEVRGRPLYIWRDRVGFDRLPCSVPRVVEFLPKEAASSQEQMTASRFRGDWSAGLSLPDGGA